MQECPEANHRVTNCNFTGNTKPIAINTNTLPDIRFLAGQAIDEIGSVGEPKSFVALNHQVARPSQTRSEEHTSELQSLMRISYAVFCLKKKIIPQQK